MTSFHRSIFLSWRVPESRATPEAVFFDRRNLMKGVAATSAAVVGNSILPGSLPSAWANEDPSSSLYPVPKNETYQIERAITPEEWNFQYNNFYEFGSHKQIASNAEALKIRPWEIAVDGLVEKPFTIAVDDLLKKMPLEERLYRHRCVEAWSMTIPWSGFQLSELVNLAKPLSGAKYVRFETFNNANMAPGQRQTWYPWPYIEGVTMEEAANELAFMVTGAYGKPIPKQMGAPLRLALPWKYGFKSIKSVVRVSFTKDRPVSFWEQLASSEYGFWANVNPDVPHPRWSQASERVLGTDERIPTQLFNGYAEQVAGLYAGLQGENLYR